MSNIITINQIVNSIKDWVDNHKPLINDFGFGNIADYGQSRRMKYPVSWLDFQTTSNIQVNGNRMMPNINFTIIFVDQVNIQHNTQNENAYFSDNVANIMSDTYLLALDFIQWLQLNSRTNGYILDENITINKVWDETQDKVSGWALNFTLKLPYRAC